MTNNSNEPEVVAPKPQPNLENLTCMQMLDSIAISIFTNQETAMLSNTQCVTYRYVPMLSEDKYITNILLGCGALGPLNT